MGAPVASGTLAGSTSGSSGSIHKKPPQRPLAPPSTLRSYDSHNLCRPREVGHRRRARLRHRARCSQGDRRHRCCEIRPAGKRGRARCRSSVSSAGCGERTIRRSAAVKTTGPNRLSEPFCESAARVGAMVEAVVPRRGRARLDVCSAAGPRVCSPANSQRSRSGSCVGTERIQSCCDLDHPAVAWPGGAIVSWLPAHALLQIVQRDNADTDGLHARNARQSSRAGSIAAGGCLWAEAGISRGPACGTSYVCHFVGAAVCDYPGGWLVAAIADPSQALIRTPRVGDCSSLFEAICSGGRLLLLNPCCSLNAGT